MPKPHTVMLQGQEFTTYEGLLSLAHELGLKSIRTRIVELPHESNGYRAVCTAEVEMQDGRVFTGIGDADPKNVNRMISLHTVRMSETRAKARALRDATNMGAAAIEELGPDAFEGKAPVTSAGVEPGSGGATSSPPEDAVWQGGEAKPPEVAFKELYDESTALIKALGLTTEALKQYCYTHKWPQNRKEMTSAQLGALVRYLRKCKADKTA